MKKINKIELKLFIKFRGIAIITVLIGLLLTSADAFDQSYRDVQLYMNQWGETHFNDCFEGRKYKSIKVLLAEKYDSYIEVNGKVYYDYGFFKNQSRDFTAYIYKHKTIFQKESKISGKEDCKTASTRFIYLFFN